MNTTPRIIPLGCRTLDNRFLLNGERIRQSNLIFVNGKYYWKVITISGISYHSRGYSTSADAKLALSMRLSNGGLKNE